jgi:protein-tyrosine phosphatase
MTNDKEMRNDMAKIVDIETGHAPVHQIDDWDFPLWSEILPNLWVGGTDDDDTLEDSVNLHANRKITKEDFDAVVTLYAWAQPVDWMVEDLRFGFYDSGISHIDMEALHRAASFAVDQVRNGNKVLIRCQAGLNRSGLTAALALIQMGYKPDEAIDLLRAKRSHYVLINKEFENFLLGLGDGLNE